MQGLMFSPIHHFRLAFYLRVDVANVRRVLVYGEVDGHFNMDEIECGG